MDYYSYFMEKKRREGIYRAKTGLLLLAIGIFLGLGNLLVYVRGTSVFGNMLLALGLLGLSVVGGILSIIGAVLVILGREVFGKTHSSQVLWSVGLFLGGIAIAVISGLLFGLALVESLRNGGSARLQDSLVSSFYTALIGSLIGGAISGLAYVFVTYSLQRSQGRIVLWAAYVATVVVNLVALFHFSSQVPTAVQSGFSSGAPNLVPIFSLQAKIGSFTSLNSILTAAYGVAYLLVWSRINRGEIPLAAAPATDQ